MNAFDRRLLRSAARLCPHLEKALSRALVLVLRLPPPEFGRILDAVPMVTTLGLSIREGQAHLILALT
jgi:hypothetical protein